MHVSVEFRLVNSNCQVQGGGLARGQVSFLGGTSNLSQTELVGLLTQQLSVHIVLSDAEERLVLNKFARIRRLNDI